MFLIDYSPAQALVQGMQRPHENHAIVEFDAPYSRRFTDHLEAK